MAKTLPRAKHFDATGTPVPHNIAFGCPGHLYYDVVHVYTKCLFRFVVS